MIDNKCGNCYFFWHLGVHPFKDNGKIHKHCKFKGVSKKSSLEGAKLDLGGSVTADHIGCYWWSDINDHGFGEDWIKRDLT